MQIELFNREGCKQAADDNVPAVYRGGQGMEIILEAATDTWSNIVINSKLETKGQRRAQCAENKGNCNREGRMDQ